MQTHIPAPADQAKQLQNKSQQQPAQLVGEQQSEFVDDRQEMAGGLQLRKLMDNGHHAVGSTALQAVMNNSPQAHAAQALQLMANASSQMNLQLKGAAATPSQRIEGEDTLQAKIASETTAQPEAATETPKPNNTGLPDNLKSGIESLSGMSMDHVKVHYNSSQPAQLNAHAYAQGNEIHMAPGQEQHLPHEAWHVVQQAQGRVKPTMQMKVGIEVNDDVGLEAEADLMGARSLGLGDAQRAKKGNDTIPANSSQRDMGSTQNPRQLSVIQRNTEITYEAGTQFDYYSTPAIRAAGGAYDQNGDVGARMVALLDLNDPRSGSGVGAGDSQRGARAATQVHPTGFVSGHLLNAGLGGLGIDANMVPITSTANALHSGIEQNVKNLLAGAPAGPALGPGAGHLRYQVDVVGAGGGALGPILDENNPDCDLNVTVQNFMLPGNPVVINVPIQSRTPPVQLPGAWAQTGTGRKSPATGGRINRVNAIGGTITNPVTGAVTPVGPNVQAAEINSVTGQWMALVE